MCRRAISAGTAFLRAQIAEQDRRLVRDDTRRPDRGRLLELQLLRHLLDVGVLLFQQLDQRLDRGRADAHQRQAALLEDAGASAGHEQTLEQRRDRLRIAELGQRQRRLLVQQEVLVVGRRGQDLHQRRHGPLVADLDQRADGRDAHVVGARLDRQLLLGRLDQRVDGVGRLHVAEHAGRDRGAVEVVVAELERLDEQRLRSLVLVARQRFQVLGALGVLVELDQRRHGGARLLDVHVGQVVERFLLRAQVLELLGPGHGIVGIALAGDGPKGEDQGEGERLDTHGSSISGTNARTWDVVDDGSGLVEHGEIAWVAKHQRSQKTTMAPPRTHKKRPTPRGAGLFDSSSSLAELYGRATVRLQRRRRAFSA